MICLKVHHLKPVLHPFPPRRLAGLDCQACQAGQHPEFWSGSCAGTHAVDSARETSISPLQVNAGKAGNGMAQKRHQMLMILIVPAERLTQDYN